MKVHGRSDPARGQGRAPDSEAARVGWCFVAFVVLVLLGSAAVSLPASTDPATKIFSFFQAHRVAVVITQLLGLRPLAVASAALLKQGGPG